MHTRHATILLFLWLFSSPALAGTGYDPKCASIQCVTRSDTAWSIAGKETGIDPILIYAIALRESKKMWPDGKVRPWPWTVNGPDGPERHSSQEDAINSVKSHLAKGKRNIDIGPMQINFRHNGYRADTVDDLFDLRENIKIGAEILAEALAATPGDLELGVGRYHAGFRPESEWRAREYGRDVLQLYARLKELLE